MSALDARRSVPAAQLGFPGPDDATLLRMLRAASRVPDHGKRVPFRFIRIAGEARDRLGALAEARLLEREPDAGDGAREKARHRFSHAPLVIAVVAVFDPDDTAIPAQERLLTAGCVCFALLQAAQALGFGAVWLTGWAADDGTMTGALGIGVQERIVGFIHIGTPARESPERERPDPAALLTDWHGS
nr:nitroreductase [Luteimonas sp. BDR2-5]